MTNHDSSGRERRGHTTLGSVSGACCRRRRLSCPPPCGSERRTLPRNYCALQQRARRGIEEGPPLPFIFLLHLPPPAASLFARHRAYPSPPPSFSSSCSVFPNVSPPNFSYAFSLNPRKKEEIESLFVPIFLFPFQVFWTIFFFPYSCGIFRSEIIFQDEKKNKNFYSEVFVQSCSIVEKIDNKKKIVEKFVYIVSM